MALIPTHVGDYEVSVSYIFSVHRLREHLRNHPVPNHPRHNSQAKNVRSSSHHLLALQVQVEPRWLLVLDLRYGCSFFFLTEVGRWVLKRLDEALELRCDQRPGRDILNQKPELINLNDLTKELKKNLPNSLAKTRLNSTHCWASERH